MNVLRKEFTVSGDILSAGVISDWKDTHFPDGELGELSAFLRKEIGFKIENTEIRVQRMSYGEFTGHKKVTMTITPLHIRPAVAMRLLEAAHFEKSAREC